MKTLHAPTDHLERLVVRDSPGQILVLFAGALVAILLIGALVVDIGFVLAMKRHEQNAADPGAIAAARYIQPTLDTSAMWTAACFYAVENGFHARRSDTSAACPGVATPDGSTVTVHYPPSAGGGEFAGDPGFVEVAINATHRSFLAGLIGLGQIPVASSAVAANEPAAGASSSLVALNPTACGAGKVHGGGGAGGVYIFPASGVTDPGGYIQINSNCGAGDAKATNDTCTDSNNQGAFVGDGGTTITGPALITQGSCDMNGSSSDFHIASVDETASFVGDPLSLVRPPSPTELSIQSCPTGPPSTAITPRRCDLNGNLTLNPGTWYGGWRINGSASITLNPGIYVIAGGGIDDTGGLLTSATGRVFIFSTDASPTWKAACIAGTGTAAACQQRIGMGGNSAIHLEGLDRTTPCPPYSASPTVGCPYGGLLMWQDAKGSAAVLGGQRCDISVGGSGSLFLSGTIYAKCGTVQINGNSSASGCDVLATIQNCSAVQIVADKFDVGGTGILQMPYDPDAFYKLTLKGLVR